MKHDISLQKLAEFLSSQEIALSNKQIEQLDHYRLLLKQWNRKHNLISRNDEESIIERHFLPSFLYVYYLRQDGFGREQKLADIGSGGGFPGIIIAICFPENSITLIESIRKKTLFLKTVSREINLEIDVIQGRIEQQEKESFNITTARALAALNKLDNYAERLLLSGGRLYTIKGADYNSEINGELSLSLEKHEIPEAWREFSSRLSEREMIILNKKV